MPTTKLPRNYQTELLNKALHQNAIVYLGTGAGKTFIATMLIKEKMDEILNEGKKTVFLVHRVPLVTQQAKFIADNTPLKVRSFCGADNIDNWEVGTWRREIERYHVLVMVHDVFKLALNHCTSFFNLTNVNLLIVDECHHSMGNSPYNQIFNGHYHPLPKDERPRVLGLTASIVTKKVTSLEKFALEKSKLEEVLDSKVITTENLAELLKYATQPHEEIVPFSPPPALTDVNKVIADGVKFLYMVKMTWLGRFSKSGVQLDIQKEIAIDDGMKLYKKFGRILAQTDKALSDLGIFHGHKLVELSEEFVREELLMTADNDLKAKLANATCQTLSDLKNCIKRKIDAFQQVDEIDTFNRLSTDKILTLVQKLEDFSAAGSDSAVPMKAIIFVQERQIAAALASLLTWIGEKKPSLSHLRVSYVVGGTSSKSFKEPGSKLYLEESQRDQLRMDSTIREFRSGFLNCLVSTSVLEEGIDITQCNLVIRFDPIQEFRSYVQSKGRARAKPSKYIIMVEAGVNLKKWQEEYKHYQKIENMQIDKCHNLLETDSGDEEDDEKEEPYYVDPSNPTKSPRITGLSAISLLCQYVQTLPADRFTRLVPFFEYEEIKSESPREKLMAGLNFPSSGNVIAYLHMPHLTPYRAPFISDPRQNKKNAKRSAALKACIQLHKDGLYDDQLLPKKRVLDFFLDELDCGKSNVPRVGTKRSKNYYSKSLPQELKCDEKSSNRWLYKINLILTETSNHAQDVKNYSIYRPQDMQRKLGVVIGGKLPDSLMGSSFDLYTISGKVMVSIDFEGAMVWPSQEIRNLAHDFHTKALQEVTGFETSIVKPQIDSDGLLVVPLTNEGSRSVLDVELLQRWASLMKTTADDCGATFTFREEDFTDAVIIPKHRTDLGNFFVEGIVKEMSPKSHLPKQADQTFMQYYKDQYGCDITNADQPLLRISNADKRHFMFAPVVANNSKVVKDYEKFLETKMLFIPELVQIHPIPASVWREMQMLPFILERVSSLLKIHHFVAELKHSLGEKTFSLQGSSKAVPNFNLLIGSEDPHEVVGPWDILEAVTHKGAGEVFNMEQLEILGDSFLKYFVTLGLFSNKTILRGNEGFLTQYRSSLIGNKRLFLGALAKKIPSLMSSTKFASHLNWLPPRFSVDSDLEKRLIQWDAEFRASMCKGQGRDEDDQEITKKKSSKVTLFQMMTVDDYARITSPEFEGQAAFLAEMRHKLTLNLMPDGSPVHPREHRIMSDKSIADVVEALIGSVLLKGGQEAAAKFLAWFGLTVCPEDSIESIISFDPCVPKGSNDWFSSLQSVMPTASVWWAQTSSTSYDSDTRDSLNLLMRKANVGQIQEQLGYVFEEKSFLLQALTHSSYYFNTITDSYERLEFLGDAVLDYLMTCHLVSARMDLSPGEITDLRSALVNNNTLAEVAVSNGFHKHLLQQSPELFKRINCYVDERLVISDSLASTAKVTLANLELNNEEDCPEYEQIEVPKALGDVIESIIGAVFLDSRCDLELTWNVIKKLFGSDKISCIIQERPKNYVAQLYELFPEKVEFRTPIVRKDKVQMTACIYKTLDRSEAMHFKGIGLNKKAAKYAAAKCAINELKRRRVIS